MRGRSLLSIADFSPSEISTILDTAAEQKARPSGQFSTALAAKVTTMR